MNLGSFTNEDYSNEEFQALIKIKEEKEAYLKGIIEEIKEVRDEIGKSNVLLRLYKQLSDTDDSISQHYHQNYKEEEQNNVLLLSKLRNIVITNSGKVGILEKEINALEKILKQYKEYGNVQSNQSNYINW